MTRRQLRCVQRGALSAALSLCALPRERVGSRRGLLFSRRSLTVSLAERRTTLIAAALLVLILGTLGSAYGYWTATGAGSGTAATGTAVAVTLSPATPATQLYPGGQSAVTLVVTNPNPFVVRIRQLALDLTQGTGGFAVDAGHTGCTLSTLGFTTQSNGGSGWDVPARVGLVDGSLTITLANALAMGATAANSCQGANFTVYLSAGP